MVEGLNSRLSLRCLFLRDPRARVRLESVKKDSMPNQVDFEKEGHLLAESNEVVLDVWVLF